MEKDVQELSENERKKRYLNSYRRAIRREQYILDEIQRLRMDKMFPSIVNDGMPSGSNQSDLSEYMSKVDEQIQILNDELLKKIKIYSDIEKRIREMKNEDEQEVLRLRYIRGLKWEEVAEEIGYGWSRTHDIHSDALKHFNL